MLSQPVWVSLGEETGREEEEGGGGGVFWANSVN